MISPKTGLTYRSVWGGGHWGLESIKNPKNVHPSSRRALLVRASQDSILPLSLGGFWGFPRVPGGSWGFLGVDLGPIRARFGRDLGPIWGRFGADQVTPIGHTCLEGFHRGWGSFTCSYSLRSVPITTGAAAASWSDLQSDSW